MTDVYEQLHFRFRVSTALVAVTLASCAVSWGILIAAHADRVGDNAGGALVLTTFATPLLAVVAAMVAMRSIAFVPTRQWTLELGLAIALFVIGLAAVAAVFIPLS